MAYSKIASTVRKLSFSAVIPDGENFRQYYIDIAQCLSIVNRRQYRQGQNYAANNMTFYSADGGDATLEILPHSWVTDNAISKAYAAWTEQRREALKELPSASARWGDFKVFMDNLHVNSGVALNLTPKNSPNILSPDFLRS